VKRAGRAGLALLLLALLALPASAVPSSGDPAYSRIDGVTYYIAAGQANGSALMARTGGGQERVAFVGCAYAQLRPDHDAGRVFVAGIVDNVTPVSVELGDLAGKDPRQQGGAATNLTLDSSLDPAIPANIAVPAEAAAWGSAEMRAGTMVNPLNGNYVPANFTDPVGGGEDLAATLAVLRDGVRGADGSLLAKPAKGADEMHVVVQSPPGAAPSPDHASYVYLGALPDGSSPSESEHQATYTLLNSRYGGTAKATLTFSSKAPPGANRLRLDVLRPDGTLVGSANATASLLGDGTATVDFPLDAMGAYTLAVAGKILMGSYRIGVDLQPAPVFQLDFWWPMVARGEQARDVLNSCQKEIGLLASVPPVRVGQHRPPSFPLRLVVLSAAVAVATGLLVVKYVSETVTADDFRRQFRK